MTDDAAKLISRDGALLQNMLDGVMQSPHARETNANYTSATVDVQACESACNGGAFDRVAL